MARELGLSIDFDGFENAMRQQRERARASWKGAEKAQVAPVYQELLERGRTAFLGYETMTCAEARIVALVSGQASVTELPAGAEAELVLDQTPFYAESGGQVARQRDLCRGARSHGPQNRRRGAAED
jgi:alanyl-tRNA synthetase